MPGIEALYNQYQQRYLLYSRDAIADLMLKDGVISLDIAQKIKNGVSLFLLDRQQPMLTPNNNLDKTGLFCGYFYEIQQKPQTSFNRKIEATFQSDKQGDCWLLSDINALNLTEWGRKAIYEAIIPDSDGSGGVTINFKGAPIEQKSFHITAEEIDKARQSKRYSKGDDDMLAFELATEKLAITLLESGKYKRCTHFDYKDPEHLTYISGGGVYDMNGITMDISTFITGRQDVELSCTEDIQVTKNFIRNLAENTTNVASVCTFQSDYTSSRSQNSPVHGNHAYAIKKIVYNKFVIIIDPYQADKEIKLPWKDFISDVQMLRVATNNSSTKNDLEKLIPDEIKNEVIQSHKDSVRINDKITQMKTDMNIVNNIFPEIADIFIKFSISEEDINFDNLKSIIKTEYLKETDFALNYRVQKQETQFEQKNPSTQGVNKDNVLLLLELKPDFIEFLDNYKSGWGKGKEKKSLILPVINAVAEKAKEKGIEKNIIEEYTKKCNKELDALIYTNEKVIQSEVEKMVKLIREKGD